MGKGARNLISQAAYARSRKERGLPGGSREAVRKAVEEGDITAFGPDRQIDPELADRQWAQNRRARISPSAAGGDLLDQAGAAAGGADGSAAAPPQPQGSQPQELGYTAARARREIAEAEIAEMNARKARGELVAWEDVARGGFEVGRDLRDALEAAVNPLSAELASLASAEACAEVLRRHNRALCDVLVKAWREKIGPVPSGGLAT